MLITPNKNYSKLYSFGCSFTNGFKQEELAQWGRYLANHLNCEYEMYGVSASSNNYIYNKIVNFCETTHETNFCIAIQWTEFSRREIYIESIDDYLAFNLTSLLSSNEFKYEEFSFLKEHFIKMNNMFFRDDEMVWRSVNSMLSTIAYLRQKNVDFIMFEGINSILDFNNENNKNFPISENKKLEILNQPEFFNTYGDMNSHMETHELFNQDNEGHPNSEYIQWWSKEMYNYILEYNNTLI